MKFSSTFFGATLAALAAASPTPIDKRATTLCDSWDSLATGAYTIFQNNWGSSAASSGSQCTTFNTLSSAGSVNWSTSWSWTGGSSSVKSYANVALQAVNKKLSAISSIPTTWTWRYTGTDIVADVSYDLWLAPSVGANNDYEIMIWVAAYGGAGPISSTGSPIATPTIAGTTWKLYSGPNGDTTVFSFVAPTHLGNFKADLMDFFDYLTAHEGVSTSQVVTSIQAGTEPFTGSGAVFKTFAYTAAVH